MNILGYDIPQHLMYKFFNKNKYDNNPCFEKNINFKRDIDDYVRILENSKLFTMMEYKYFNCNKIIQKGSYIIKLKNINFIAIKNGSVWISLLFEDWYDLLDTFNYLSDICNMYSKIKVCEGTYCTRTYVNIIGYKFTKVNIEMGTHIKYLEFFMCRDRILGESIEVISRYIHETNILGEIKEMCEKMNIIVCENSNENNNGLITRNTNRIFKNLPMEIEQIINNYKNYYEYLDILNNVSITNSPIRGKYNAYYKYKYGDDIPLMKRVGSRRDVFEGKCQWTRDNLEKCDLIKKGKRYYKKKKEINRLTRD